MQSVFVSHMYRDPVFTDRRRVALLMHIHHLFSLWPVLRRQLAIGGILSAALFFVAFGRVTLALEGPKVFALALTVAVSLCLVVIISIVAGCLLPFGLARLGVDPGHGGPMCQVLMDVLGVLCICLVTEYMLPIPVAAAAAGAAATIGT